MFKDTSNKSSLVVGCVIPQVEVTLVMPSQTPGKESSGGDAESVIPDSASLGDDLHISNYRNKHPFHDSIAFNEFLSFQIIQRHGHHKRHHP